MPPQKDTNGWSDWSKHVLLELTRLNTCYEGLRKDVDSISRELAALRVKSGLWGMLGAAIPVSLGILVYWLKN